MPSKFFCGRKMIYGLNMMGVCDSRRRFTLIEVNMFGAASNFYAFNQSSLKKKLETEGFLHPGYCLFGDNAYVNTQYMCMPWRNVSSGPKDGMIFSTLLFIFALNAPLGSFCINGVCCVSPCQSILHCRRYQASY